jgi:hypothetical protein
VHFLKVSQIIDDISSVVFIILKMLSHSFRFACKRKSQFTLQSTIRVENQFCKTYSSQPLPSPQASNATTTLPTIPPTTAQATPPLPQPESSSAAAPSLSMAAMWDEYLYRGTGVHWKAAQFIDQVSVLSRSGIELHLRFFFFLIF